jgi:hypothetical protein
MTNSAINRSISQELPFRDSTEHEIELQFQGAKSNIQTLMGQHGLYEYIKDNFMHDLFNPQNYKACDYYDEEKFINCKRNDSLYLNVFSMNIRSLPKHSSILSTFLSTLETQFDLIVLTEIGSRNLSTVKHLFKNYDFYFVPPDGNMFGGVGIYVNNNHILDVEVLDLCINMSCGCSKCAVESTFIKFTRNKCKYVLGGIYRHPNGNVQHFSHYLEETLVKLNDDNLTVILTGDINIDIIKFEIENNITYLSTLLSHRYLPFITLPSRITDFSATCIDHIFVKFSTKNLALINECLSGLFYCDISDHLPCFLSVKCQTHIDLRNRPKIRLYGDINGRNFVTSMQSTDWNALFTPDNDWYDAFLLKLKHIYNSCFPLVRVSRSRIKDKPWLTTGLKKSIRTNHRMYRSSLHDTSITNIQKYKKYRNTLRKCLKDAENAYFHSLFENTKQSSFKIWRHLSSVINPDKQKSTSNISKLDIDGHVSSDNKLITNYMNKYFCNIGQTLQNKLTTNGDQYKNYLLHRVNQSFFLSPITPECLLKEINSLSPYKSSGPDDISVKIIKLCPNIFAENLALIFNRSIEIGQYPTLMKVAKVIALFKKGDRSKANNYRPISLLSIFNKLFEKILCKKLVSFLNHNNAIFKFQFGFRKLYSTTLALIEFTDSIRRLLDDGNYAISIFVDLTKAFDTVDHEILLHKLDFYGIRGHANNFFRSYLSGRSQYTIVNGESSDINNIHCGVPQGSVLGPLFFALYINDMYTAVGEDHIRLFADDTALYMWSNDLPTLVENIKVKFSELHKWCLSNKLIINNDKTNFVLFHAKNKQIPKNFKNIHIGRVTIDRVPHFKYLGVTLDESLNWNKHVDNICASLVKYFGIFNQIKSKLSTTFLRQLYYAFVYSKIKYAIEVYGNCSLANLRKVQILQNKLLKLLFSYDRFTDTNELHDRLQILKVKDIFETSILNFVNECLSERCPEIFLNYFVPSRPRYNLRRSDQVIIPPSRLSLGDKAVRVYGALAWNNMDDSLRKYCSQKNFRQHVLKYYISTYAVVL